MTARLLHVSDLHVGAHEDFEVAAALVRFVERMEPKLVVASGDLSHRGRPAQLEQAAGFLRSLGPPVLAVPGNHDLPHTPARFVRPWAEFERVWETTEPVAALPGLHVIGLNSARPFRHQGGAIGRTQLKRASAQLAGAEEGAVRVAVLHHHLANSPWRAAHKRPVSRRRHLLHTLAAAGVELILCGHIHQAAAYERHEFEVLEEGGARTVIAVAPGLGRPRPHRLGEARGLHVHEIDDEAIAVRTYLWTRGDFVLAAERRFRRLPVLDEAAPRVEERRGTDQGKDQAGRPADEQPRDHAAEERAHEAEHDGAGNAQRIAPRESEPREGADEQALAQQRDDEPERH